MSDTMKLPNLENQNTNTEDLMQDLDDEPNLSKHKVTTHDLEAVYTIPINVKAVLGEARMEVNQLLKLGRGAVVELDRKVGEPIDIYVNNRLVARGEVVIVDDRLGVTVTEIIKSGAV